MPPRHRAGRDRRASRRGNAVWLAASIMVMMAFVALVVDVGHARMVKSQLDLACDAASHAGAADLDGTTLGMDLAREQALQVAALHTADNAPVHDPEVTLGSWEDGTFTESADPELVNAVRVAARRSSIVARFAPLAFGRDRMGAASASIALKPPPAPAVRSACYLPLALPSCMLETHTLEELADTTLVLNPRGGNNVGWAMVTGSASANAVRNQMVDCEEAGPANVGEPVNLSGGVMTSALEALAQAVEQSETTWYERFAEPLPEPMEESSVASAHYGKTLEAPILIFESDEAYCQGIAHFNGTEPLMGFAWAVVWDVRSTGEAEDKNIRVRLDPFADELAGLRGHGSAPLVGVLGQQPPQFVQ